MVNQSIDVGANNAGSCAIIPARLPAGLTAIGSAYRELIIPIWRGLRPQSNFTGQVASAMPMPSDLRTLPKSVVLLACMLASMVSVAPIIATTVSIFIMPISKEFGWGRAVFPQIIMVSALVGGAFTPLAGRALDRFGSKPVMIVGATVFALANVCAAFNDGNILRSCLIYIVLGTSGSFTGTFGVNKIVSVWFTETRGRALGVSVGLGVGLGAALTPLLTQYFIQHGGWRDAYVALGAAIFLLTVPPVLFLTPNTKQAPGISDLSAPMAARLSFRDLAATREFWLLVLLTFANSFGSGGIMGHWIPIQSDHGVSITLATLLLSSFGLLKIVAQVGGGVLLDKIQTPKLAFALLIPVFLGILAFTSAKSGALLVAGAVLFGLGEGAEVGLLPYFVGRYFGVRHIAGVYGYVAAAAIIGSSTGNVAMGGIHDATGGYSVGVWICAASIILALLAAAFLGPYKVPLPVGGTSFPDGPLGLGSVQ